MALDDFMAPLSGAVGPLRYNWVIEPDGGTGDGQVAHGRSRWVERLQIANNSAIVSWSSICENILGVAQRAGGGKLARKLPLKHPYFDEWYCQEISGWRFSPGYEGPDPDRRPCVKPTRMELSVVVGPAVYDIFPDDDGQSDESYRYVSGLKTSSPYLDAVDTGTGTLKYSSGVEGPQPGGVPAKDFRGSAGLIVSKYALNWTWHMVPVNAVLDANGIPTNIAPCVGCVNDADWRGRKKGTVLLEAPKIVENPAAASVRTLFGGLTKTGTAPLYVDITFPMKYFDLDGTGIGWNYFPDKTGAWILCTRDGTNSLAAGNTLYRYADFSNLFKTI